MSLLVDIALGAAGFGIGWATARAWRRRDIAASEVRVRELIRDELDVLALERAEASLADREAYLVEAKAMHAERPDGSAEAYLRLCWRHVDRAKKKLEALRAASL